MGAVIKIIAIVLLFTGCKTKQIPVFVERVIKDSIVIRDTLTEVKLEPYFEERTTRDTTLILRTSMRTARPNYPTVSFTTTWVYGINPYWQEQ